MGSYSKSTYEDGLEDPVVIVGLSFRFPGDAVSEESFWELLRDGRSTMTEVPTSRYNINGHYCDATGRQHGVTARGGHFIKGDISAFDAPFFKMSAAEAKAMDPQLRILLETTYHALESANLSLDDVAGSNTSVYVGSLSQEYDSLFAFDEEIDAKYQAIGTSSSMLSNRVSWFYDLRGSSVTVDTACSSSLIGLHHGCHSLLQGESDMSLVGGVQLQLEPRKMTAAVSRLGFLSPDSQCYSFDDRANGYSRGEGVAMLVLKRLSKALEDGDTIRTVIRGTSTNQDGRTPSITAPSATAQASLIQRTYQRAGLDFRDTGYFEAHGTGTAVGDPIEASGISQAFTAHREHENPLNIGSVKANIGHLESSAGLAGLVKAVLVLEKGVIPPNALLKNLNPKILADKWHLNFPTTSIPWPKQGLRRASVNSFGYGGTNAHIILDDAMHYLQSRDLRGKHNVQPISSQNGLLTNGHSHTNGVNGHSDHKANSEKMLFLLSAADENGIGRQASSLEAHLGQPEKELSESDLRDVAFTLSRSRALLPWKSFVLASSASELRKGLLDLVNKPVRSTKSPPMHFVFTGQGAQWASMGVELLTFPVFRESVEYADAYLRSIGSRWSALDELCKPASSSSIHNPNLAQPLCTILQIALVDLLSSWNIHPEAVVGHSSGEIAAAYCAGSLSRDSALRVAYFRGECVSKLLQDTKREQGGMIAVGLSAEELQPHIQAVLRDGDAKGLQCGCLNSPKSTTVTGLDKYIDALASRLGNLKIFARKLNVPVAYHSRQMLAVADSYRASLEGHLKPGAKGASLGFPSLFSSVTGLKASKSDLSSAEYWVQNLVSPVKFSEALHLMYTSLASREESQTKPLTYIVEVGPHCSLERPIRDTLPEDSAFVYDYTLRRNSSSADDVKRLAGRSAAHGYAVDVQTVNGQYDWSREPKVLFDLPKYAFNHSQSYWVESRLSRNVRTREHPRHELLGTRSADWNPLRPTWRLVIRDSDLPWVNDHKVDGIILYPAAGMLVMAIEGLRSLQTDLSRVSGFTLKDVNIGSALVVPPGDEGVETQLHLGPCNPTSDTQKGVSAWFFWIHSVTNDEWKLHCSGQISVVENAADDIVSEDPTGEEFAQESSTRSFGKVFERCSSPIERKAFYQAVLDKSIDLGDTFRTMHDIRFNESGREATANLPFGDWRQQVRDMKLSEHLIHPTTLDGLLHIPFASIFPKLPVIPSVVPRQITEIYISNDLLSDAAGDTLRLYGNTTELGVFHINADVAAVGSSSEKPLVYLRGVKLLGFHATDQRGAVSSGPTSLFHRFEWKPDVSFLSQGGIEEYCREHTARKGVATSGFDGETERVCRYFLSAMLEELDATASEKGPAISSKPSIQSYVKWARSFLESESQSTASLREAYPGYEDDNLRPALIEKFASKSVQNRDTIDYGRKLVPIVREEVDALALLFNDGLAERLYQSPTFSLTSHRLAAYMDLVGHKNSDLKILEVGAGTGSTTTAVLDVLSSPSLQAPRFSHYDFTDISPSFFADASERYAAHTGRIGFKVFDVERDPEEQGFEPGSYDVVIAAAVIHATSSIDKSLRNIKKLLKPGGQIVFWEPTSRRIASIPFFVGVLPGWWLSTEKIRSSGPLLTEPEWNEALLRADFDGLHVSLQDDDDGNHVNSLLVSRAQDSPSRRENLSTVIVTGNQEHEGLAVQLQAHLRSRSSGLCDIIHADLLSQAETVYDQCICLMELGNPIMAHLDDTKFEALRRVTAVATQIIWVTDGCGVGAQNPEASIVAGFAKVLERERPGLSFVHLSVHNRDNAEQTILRIVDKSHTLSPEDQETDILEEDGQILVPRAVEAPDINRLLDSEKHGLQPQLTDVSDSSEEGALELRFSPGRLQSIHFGPDATSSNALQDNEVRVLVKAAGVNFRDVMVTLNQVSDSHMGAEFAGVVVEAGASWKSVFSPGDRVCGPLDGSFRTLVRIPGANLIKIPSNLTFAEAASVPVAYATAQYALRYLARIQPGESILVHAAAGGVGQAAVHLAQRAGAVVYATVSTPEKKKILMERFGIPAGRIFSSRHTLFASQILERTGGRGVDVVLNSLAGHALAESWRCLAHLGRFVEIGKRDIRAFNRLPMEPFSRNVSFSSLDLKVLADHNPALLSTIMQEIQDLVWDEKARPHLVPYPLTVFKRSGFEEAFRLLQSGRHSGKVVVDWEQADTIKVVPKSPLDYSFDPNATYVITGGLGGIGRNLAGWMARNGARNLCLLSRSGPVTAASKDLVTALEQDGVRLYAPACDVSDPKAVADVVAHVEAHMPPIKGCIHSAMAIENRVFENYDLPTFNSAFPAKVQGTYNLHNNLPRGMDFFVILGSIAAFIGPASQSNYGGVSSFQDAFARFRRSEGEHCLTIDLGAVEGIGYIAERVAVARNVDMMFVDHKILREPDIHFMLKWACNPRLSSTAPNGSPWAANVVAGLTTPAFVRRGGILRDHKWMRIPMFRHLYRMELGDGQQQGQKQQDDEGGENAGALLRAAKTQAEAAGVVTHLFAKRLARSLAVPVEDIDVGRPAYAFGVDSLVAVELLFWFSSEIRADVPVVQILGSSTIAQLGAVAAAKSEHLHGLDLPA